jgi:hypothetical protein
MAFLNIAIGGHASVKDQTDRDQLALDTFWIALPVENNPAFYVFETCMSRAVFSYFKDSEEEISTELKDLEIRKLKACRRNPA